MKTENFLKDIRQALIADRAMDWAGDFGLTMAC
jgi:hypothetical protein